MDPQPPLRHGKMTAMSDTAATIFSATAGGAFALAVAYISYRAGRRQTTDQATVEHGQWLRGQRQQAFATYLEAWDRAQQALEDIAKNIDEHTSPEYFDQERYDEEVAANMSRLLDEAVEPIQKPYEQLMLIVPPEVLGLVDRAAEKLFAMSGRLRDWALCGWDGEANRSHHAQFHRTAGEAVDLRAELFQASRAFLLSPPAPGGR
jgi:hypothetical protein